MPEAVKPLRDLACHEVDVPAVAFHLAHILLGIFGPISEGIRGERGCGQVNCDCSREPREQYHCRHELASGLEEA